MGARQPEVAAASTAAGSSEPSAPTTQTTRANQIRDQPPLASARGLAELLLDPVNANVGAGEWQAYKATLRVLVGRYPWSWDVTGLTGFAIDDPDGSCERLKGKVRCSAAKLGPNTVTGILPPRAIPLVSYQVEGTATLEVTEPPEEPDHLRLDPNPKTIQLGEQVTYKAFAEAKDNTELGEVTDQTDFSIDQDGPCPGATCTPTKTGKPTVTGRLRDHRPTVEGTATLEVTEPPEEPDHLRLDPNPKTIQLGEQVTYKAFAEAKDNTELGEVTDQTDFSITPSGDCSKASCTPTEVGDHTVTGRLTLGRRTVEGSITLRVIDPVVSLALNPTSAEIPVGTDQDYTAEGTTAAGRKVVVTDQTGFTITAPGKCSQAPGKVSCTATQVGDYTVTATLTQKGRDPITATAVLAVGPTTSTTTTTSGTTTTIPASQPVISSVQPGFTFAGMSVEVGGNTGSCSRAGILTFHGNIGDVSVKVTADRQGNFVARVTIPKGTLPTAYKLELTVDCHGQLQRAQGDLSVVNIAPTAANDSAKTIQDTPVSIPVTDNDRNPDPDTGYSTLVLVSSTPSHGTAETQTDQSIVYTPEQGFVGQDQFQYSLCDDIINAAGTADCGTATVTVTVTDAKACLPSPGNTPSIKVNPSKSPGGTTLGITATVDRKLAGCPFRLLLGGTPLPPDVPAGPDGGITAERGIPKDAKPGPSTIRLATRLATMRAQTLAETPFEVVPPGLSLPLKLLIGAGALLAGALARIAFRRWRTSQKQRRQRRLSQLNDLQVEPHTRPVEVTVEPEHDNTRTFTVRLEPHPDPGNQTVQEMNP
jgi:Bacterial Ig domain